MDNVTLPVRNVCAADHGGQIRDRISCHTRLVKLRILSNQMTSQKSTVRASHHSDLLLVKVTLLQNTVYRQLFRVKQTVYYIYIESERD